MTDWLKPGAVPPEAASDDVFATPSGVVGSPDAVDSPHEEEVLRDELAPPAAPGVPRTGQTTAAGGGYGTASGLGSSGGSGEGTDDTSRPGDDAQTNWLRDAPGGRDE